MVKDADARARAPGGAMTMLDVAQERDEDALPLRSATPQAAMAGRLRLQQAATSAVVRLCG